MYIDYTPLSSASALLSKIVPILDKSLSKGVERPGDQGNKDECRAGDPFAHFGQKLFDYAPGVEIFSIFTLGAF